MNTASCFGSQGLPKPDSRRTAAVPIRETPYYVFDGLGSVVNLVDTSGNVAASYAYDPYGGTTATGAAAAGNPFRFAAGHLDPTGLYKFGTRYYDAAYGRWTQRDPIAGDIGDPGTVNRYAYAGCDPINNIDPSGRSFIGAIGRAALGCMRGVVQSYRYALAAPLVGAGIGGAVGIFGGPWNGSGSHRRLQDRIGAAVMQSCVPCL